MSLRGQDTVGERGYAMAALLVALAVMAVMMSVAMPVWRHEAQREKEAELVFRGIQYIRGVRLYQTKFHAFPTSIDEMIAQHCLRKHYKDPITNDEFDLVGVASPQPGVTGQPGQIGGRGPTTTVSSPAQQTASPFQQSAIGAGSAPGGIIGVRSKSKDESIMVYNGRNHYNEWTFMYVQQGPVGPNGQPGRGQPGRGPNGQPVGPNGQPIGPNGQPIGPGRGRDGRGGPIGPGRGFGPGGVPFPLPPGRGRGGL